MKTSQTEIALGIMELEDEMVFISDFLQTLDRNVPEQLASYGKWWRELQFREQQRAKLVFELREASIQKNLAPRGWA